MLKMVTKEKHEYAGENLGPGDEFTAESQAHVDLLTALGRAEPKADQKPNAVTPGSRTRRSRGLAS